MSDAGTVHFSVSDGIARVVFDRPQARNAMTWAMYDALAAACAAIVADPSVRVAILRGAGGHFVAGTDIGQFSAFTSAEDGVAYEERMEAVVATLESLRVPTVAILEGAAMGGGLMIATVCDIRIATPDAKMGVPIARTLGNCLSIANTARLVAAFGINRTKRLLVQAEAITASEAATCGFVAQVTPPAAIEETMGRLCDQLCANAPLTMSVAKESIRRIGTASLPDGVDLLRLIYGSADFRTGVRAFLDKRKPQWQGG